MLRLSDIRTYLLTGFPTAKIYQGFIDKTENQCIGIFTRPNASKIVAVGGSDNGTYSRLSTSILIHWGQDTDVCETFADQVFEFLHYKKGIAVGSKYILFVDLEGAGPIDIQRDENNICEMVINADFYYTR